METIVVFTHERRTEQSIPFNSTAQEAITLPCAQKGHNLDLET